MADSVSPTSRRKLTCFAANWLALAGSDQRDLRGFSVVEPKAGPVASEQDRSRDGLVVWMVEDREAGDVEPRGALQRACEVGLMIVGAALAKDLPGHPAEQADGTLGPDAAAGVTHPDPAVSNRGPTTFGTVVCRRALRYVAAAEAGMQGILHKLFGTTWRAARRVLMVAACATVAACGGDSGDGTSASPGAAGATGQPSGIAPIGLTLDPPQAINAGQRIGLRWQLDGDANAVIVRVQRSANAGFQVVDAEVSGNTATFDRGPARHYDFPTAAVRVDACNTAGQCVQSNVRPLADLLLGGVAQLRARPPGVDALFGGPLSFSANGKRVAVVDRPNDYEGPNGDFPDRGQVYVYDRAASGAWTQTALLERPDVLNNFATSLALSGDGNTLVVGSSSENGKVGGIDVPEVEGLALSGTGTTDSFRGAVHVYARGSNGGWAHQAFIKPSTPVAFEHFSWRVALSDDGTRLLVGARERSILFRRVANSWQEVQTFEPGLVGRDLGPAATLSRDGRTVARVVGTPSATDPGGPSTYSIVIFRGSADGSAWPQTATVTSPLGGSLAGPALSGDGGTLLATAIVADNTPTGYSIARGVFRPNGGGVWSLQAWLKTRAPQPSEDALSNAAPYRISADGRVIAIGARGYVQHVEGLNRNHAAGAEIDPALLDSTSELGGAVYVFEEGCAGDWNHVANVLPGGVGDQTSAYAFEFDLSADGQTLGLGTTVYTRTTRDERVSIF